MAIGNVYRTEEFFIGEDMFVSLSKETALGEVTLLDFAVALFGVALIFSRAGAEGNKIIITIAKPRITWRNLNFLSI